MKLFQEISQNEILKQVKDNQSMDDLKSFEIDEQFIQKNMLSDSHNYGEEDEEEQADQIC